MVDNSVIPEVRFVQETADGSDGAATPSANPRLLEHRIRHYKIEHVVRLDGVEVYAGLTRQRRDPNANWAAAPAVVDEP